ncbi:MAG: division/cell wall cluster transcriptional repressor MraZ [Zetaproteobacteria bacterium]|nr:MAG: division/cell wall cluster transcriptional repressor MraZ [Zetaproteobacteria bacterium]
MFEGEYNVSLDDKGRVSIPAPYREALRRGYDDLRLVVTRDYDGCISLYPPREWERTVLAEVRRRPFNDPWARALQSFMISAAVTCTPDRQGRIPIAQSLRAYAQLRKKVVFSGGLTHFQLWDEARRAEKLQRDLEILRAPAPPLSVG